jgi:hypothetical protein
LIDQFNIPIKNVRELLGTYEYFISKNTYTALRDLAAHSMGVFSLLRSDNQRALELADIFGHDYEENGECAATAMVVALRGGKTSRNGQTQFGAFLRHVNVLVCPWATHSIMFFAR